MTSRADVDPGVFTAGDVGGEVIPVCQALVEVTHDRLGERRSRLGEQAALEAPSL